MNHKFLVHKRGDHVGVAVADIAGGEHVEGVFMDDDSTIVLAAADSVPFGHKIAIAEVSAGASVLEYGIPIGTAPDGLTTGAYVHIHNLRSARW
jgi:(2R)-sulfolactate sulfo-lyase subunit alpha